MRRANLIVCTLGAVAVLGIAGSLACGQVDPSKKAKKPNGDTPIAKAAASPPTVPTGVDAIEAALKKKIGIELADTPSETSSITCETV